MNPLDARRRLLGRNVYKKTVEGNPAIAQGSLARRYPGITMQGWTEQAQYEGKNLFDILDFESNNNGIIENGTILFKQSLGTVTYYLNLNPGTYSISVKRSGYSEISIKINEVAVINNGGSNNYTGDFDVSDEDSVVLELSEGQNPNGEDRMIYDIMLNSGSAALPYEPYTGGAPSPNPDYPQPITSAGKYDEETQKYQYEAKLTGKNLFDAEYFRTTLDWKQPADANSYQYIPIYIGKGNTITISTDGTPAEGLGFYCTIARTNKSTNGNVYTWIYHSTSANLIKTNVSFGVVEDDYIYFSLNTGHGNIEKFLNAFPNFQIEISAQRTEYQPYKEQTVTLTADRPLTKWDKLEKHDGVWGWAYKSNVLTYDGDENWSYDTNNTRVEYSALYYWDTRLLNKNCSYCNKFRHIVQPYDGEGIMDNNGDSRSFYVSIRTDRLDSPDADGFKQWLQSNPLTVWYETEEETFVPLSESEQEQMNELYTFRPTTVLSNDCECNMSLTYKTKKSLEVTT